MQKRLENSFVLSALAVALLSATSGAEVTPATSRASFDNDGQRTTQSKRPKPKKLWGVSWYATVEDALAEAEKKSRKARADKPVLWLRMLGDLEGKT